MLIIYTPGGSGTDLVVAEEAESVVKILSDGAGFPWGKNESAYSHYIRGNTWQVKDDGGWTEQEEEEKDE